MRCNNITSTAQKSSRKVHHHGEAVRLIPLHGYVIFCRPLAGTYSWWTGQGHCRRILFYYVKRLRKKLISTLSILISFFNLLPTWSPRNRCDCAPLTSPSGFASFKMTPLSCLCFLVGCRVKSSSGGYLKPWTDFLIKFFVPTFTAPNDVKYPPPHVWPRSILVTTPPPITHTLLWLVVVCFFINWWPSTAVGCIFQFPFPESNFHPKWRVIVHPKRFTATKSRKKYLSTPLLLLFFGWLLHWLG